MAIMAGAPEPQPPPPHRGPPLAVVRIREEVLRQPRYTVAVYGASGEQVRRVCRLLASRFLDGGKVFRLRRSPAVQEWSLPATAAYAEALCAVFAGQEWVAVIWPEREVRGRYDSA